MRTISKGDVEKVVTAIIRRRLKNDLVLSRELAIDTPILGKGLGLDSLDALALVTEIEEEFDILFDDEELTLDLFVNIGTLAAQIDTKLLNNHNKGG